MNFKPSAGIFVAGLATSFGGGLLLSMGMGMASGSSGGGAAAMAFLGFAASVAGLIMLCIGATRALRIIDALPAAFRTVNGSLGQQAPAQFHNQPQHQGYGQQPPVQ